MQATTLGTLGQQLAANWWMLALRGVLGILFGLLAIFAPSAVFGALVLLFGAYAFVDGVFALVTAFSKAGQGQRLWLILEGVVGIIAGLLAFFQTALVGLTLILIFAAWAIVTGIFEIVTAIQLRKEIDNEWMLLLSGVLSVIFGVLVFFFPEAGAFTVVTVIGVYAIIFGIVMLVLSLRLRGMKDTMGTSRTATA